MPIPFRSELQAFLIEFAGTHRGVRLGTMFGLPALYVGRRLVACLIEHGLIVRLRDDLAVEEIRAKHARPYSRRGHRLGRWVMYAPRTARAARVLVPVVERAARHVAEQQVEETTGIRLTRRRRT